MIRFRTTLILVLIADTISVAPRRTFTNPAFLYITLFTLENLYRRSGGAGIWVKVKENWNLDTLVTSLLQNQVFPWPESGKRFQLPTDFATFVNPEATSTA